MMCLAERFLWQTGADFPFEGTHSHHTRFQTPHCAYCVPLPGELDHVSNTAPRSQLKWAFGLGTAEGIVLSLLYSFVDQWITLPLF